VADDIVPVQLALTEGDFVTLWAPRWRDGAEEWEAFLGDDDTLYGFPDVAHLAAFVRSDAEHDLSDHPAWPVVQELTVEELSPTESQQYDVIGVPELVAERPDNWTIAELAEITAVVRSLASVCGLDVVHDVLADARAFALLERGTLPFAGREGARLWDRLGEVVIQRWDEVVDALDALIATPPVDPAALSVARRELVEKGGIDAAELAEAGPHGFWDVVGIDPTTIVTVDGEFYTLRCYLDDHAVFLGSGGRIDVFPSPKALARYLAGDGRSGHDLTAASTWPAVVERAAAGELEIVVDAENNYNLTGLDEDIAAGPTAIDPTQLDLGVELLTDVGDWAKDPEAAEALSTSESLGWLVSYVTRPDPTRLAPSPPFTDEAARWNELVEELGNRLRQH
jgi:hypothetical protein